MHMSQSRRVTAWGVLIVTLILGLVSCSLISDRKGRDSIPVMVDLEQTVGTFAGMGANVPISFYNRRTKPLQVLNDLQVKYIRVKRSGENWDDILALRAATHRLKIKWIYSLEEIPALFLNESGQLGDIEGFAIWWAEEVDELNYQEVPADLIELVQRPEHSASGRELMDPDTYNELLHALRKELDLRDYGNVGFVGPGLSGADLNAEKEMWYSDLDQEAYEALNAWTVELWDDTTRGKDLGGSVRDFQAYLEMIESSKPVFISAYATSHTVFGSQRYPDPAHYDILGNKLGYEKYYYSASFSIPYGLRVYSNTLKLLSNPETVPFIHQLYDAPDQVKYQKQSWGLLDLNGQDKPVFTYLSSFLKRVPDGAQIIPVSLSSGNAMTALAFKDRSKLIITLCSEHDAAQNIRIAIKGADRSLTLLKAESLESQGIYDPDMGKPDEIEKLEPSLKVRYSSEDDAQSFQYTIKANSVLIVEFDLQ